MAKVMKFLKGDITFDTSRKEYYLIIENGLGPYHWYDTYSMTYGHTKGTIVWAFDQFNELHSNILRESFEKI